MVVEQQTRLFAYIQRASSIMGRDRAWRILEDLVKEKRMAWMDRRRIFCKRGENPVDRAFELFYKNYLRLSLRDVEIVEKSDKRIVMRWRNPCPTLEACKALGLDTRYVCKMVYENPTQGFIKRVDDRLRFSRNYDAIRPYATYCEETIELV